MAHEPMTPSADLLVDVPGRGTVTVPGGRAMTAAAVLKSVAPAAMTNKDGAPRLELWFGRRRYAPRDRPDAGELARVVVAGCGLRGGKGGFGAMLRSMGKAGGGTATRDFGACRDLSGRRLRHVNDEIALERWHEARARNEARKRSGGAAVEEDEAPVAGSHGIRGWHLAVPAWAELPKARKPKSEVRKDARNRSWADEEQDVLASGCTTKDFEAEVTMVDSVHLGFCIAGGDCYVPASANCNADDDWSGCGATPKLRVGDTLKISAALRPHGRNAWNAYKAERVGFASTKGKRGTREKRVDKHIRQPRYVEEALAKKRDARDKEARRRRDDKGAELEYVGAEAMASSVAAGLLAADRSKKQKRKDDAAKASAFRPANAGSASLVATCLDTVAGEAELRDGGVAHGRSEFATVAVASVAPVAAGKWYYEATILTGGVVQVGWCAGGFEHDDAEGDGVGDDARSWAFDGCRGRKWTAGADEAYGSGEPWARGDVVGCALDADGGSLSFSVNGTSPAPRSRLAADAGGFFAALSLEDNEAVRVAIDAADFRFPPPPGHAALGRPAAAPAPAAPAAPRAAADAAPEAPAARPKRRRPPRRRPKRRRPPRRRRRPRRRPRRAPARGGAQRTSRAAVAPAALDLGDHTQASLEALGLDRLKAALLALGLKCGGTSADRASRLLSTRGVDRSAWDKKLLAKPGK
ncbi:subtilase-like protein [Aureococcus anophagefferens]|nr:subtilase-like protein [Aureococcus anophagefferens]